MKEMNENEGSYTKLIVWALLLGLNFSLWYTLLKLFYS